MSPKAGFSKAHHVRTAQEFQKIRMRGFSFFGSVIRINYLLTTDSCPKLGISVLKKLGKAPTRNRFKRLVREVFRVWKNDLPIGVEMRVSPLSSIGDLTLEQIQIDFGHFLNKIRYDLIPFLENNFKF